MTGENKYLEDLKYDTFTDGAKCKIIRKGKLDDTSLPSTSDVIFVQCVTTNFISISKLCDQELYVNFNHSECIITNKHQE